MANERLDQVRLIVLKIMQCLHPLGAFSLTPPSQPNKASASVCPYVHLSVNQKSFSVSPKFGT